MPATPRPRGWENRSLRARWALFKKSAETAARDYGPARIQAMKDLQALFDKGLGPALDAFERAFPKVKEMTQHKGKALSTLEPPRDSRRLHFLRGWGHEQIDEVFAGGPRAGSSAGV
jgi:hypothetical protein